MELGKQPDNTIKGRYFYESSGVDIPLFGKESDIVEPYPLKICKPMDKVMTTYLDSGLINQKPTF